MLACKLNDFIVLYFALIYLYLLPLLVINIRIYILYSLFYIPKTSTCRDIVVIFIVPLTFGLVINILNMCIWSNYDL